MINRIFKKERNPIRKNSGRNMTAESCVWDISRKESSLFNFPRYRRQTNGGERNPIEFTFLFSFCCDIRSSSFHLVAFTLI